MDKPDRIEMYHGYAIEMYSIDYIPESEVPCKSMESEYEDWYEFLFDKLKQEYYDQIDDAEYERGRTGDESDAHYYDMEKRAQTMAENNIDKEIDRLFREYMHWGPDMQYQLLYVRDLGGGWTRIDRVELGDDTPVTHILYDFEDDEDKEGIIKMWEAWAENSMWGIYIPIIDTWTACWEAAEQEQMAWAKQMTDEYLVKQYVHAQEVVE